MPADREFALPGAGARVRDFARRHGLFGSWQWWTRELAALVPATPRAAVQRRRMRPVIAFDGDGATLWRPDVKDGRLRMVEAATLAIVGDPATVNAAGRAAFMQLARVGGGGAVLSPKVIVSLPPRAVLRKSLVLPVAVEENLRQALAYDLDRHTPFKSDELYFDAAVVERDNARGQIRVDLAAARRTQVDTAVKQVAAWGATPSAVVPELPGAAAASRLNLLPAEMRNGYALWKRWQFWLPIALLGVVAVAAVVLPVWQKREYAIAQNEVAAQVMQQAAVAEALRAQLERQVGDYNFALERKYAYPGTMQILEDVTRLLPDDTWLTQLEVRTSGRGKDMQRELLFRGESANAGRLVTLLEDSRLFTQAAPRSPTTKIQPGPGEIFDLGAQMKPLASPAPIALAALEKLQPAAPPSKAAAPSDAAPPIPPPAAPPRKAAALPDAAPPIPPPPAAAPRRAAAPPDAAQPIPPPVDGDPAKLESPPPPQSAVGDAARAGVPPPPPSGAKS
jgi:general secretion pathway protein L